ncbi:enoyl-CoA hydratase [Pseudonocardia yuanmonensis]|uniref:Enoyl-CoA hydratase n=1 Tax=Pseudonocardia yuanmonensis TaxID=1095914 RepID=A0ABP8VY38_9PSEU
MTESTTENPVLVETADGIRTVTLNRPRRKNALNAGSWDGLQRAFADAANDPSVRVLVLTGAGGDFCAGADLSGGPAGGHPLSRMHRINEIAMALHSLPMPTVAKVSGVAVGAGWNLALGCDLVVAERDARFSQIFAKRGLSLDFGGSWLLPKIVGLQQAKRLALLAEIIGAEEAERLGLVTYVVEPGTIDAFTADLAKTLAAGAPMALAQSKRMLNENTDKTLREALESEARAQTINFAGTDAPAAFEAFMAKRDPVFTGEWAVK